MKTEIDYQNQEEQKKPASNHVQPPPAFKAGQPVINPYARPSLKRASTIIKKEEVKKISN